MWSALPYQPGHLGRPLLGQQEDLSTWSLRDKVLFLGGYGWIAAATAKDIPFGVSETYTGILGRTSDVTRGFLGVVLPFLGIFSSGVRAALEGMEAGLGDIGSASGKARSAFEKYKKLRKEIIEDLVRKGHTVEYERWGDHPDHPGELVKSKVGPEGGERPPDFSFVFAPMSMKEFVEAGIKFQDKSQELGHKIKEPFRLSGSSTPRLGVLWIAAIAVIAVAVALALWAFFGMWALSEGDPQKEAFLDNIKKAVENGDMTEEEAAEAIAEYDKQRAWYEDVFGTLKEGVNVFIVVAIAVVAIPLVGSVAGWFD